MRDVSRRTVMEMIKHGDITLNGKPTLKSQLLHVNDCVELWQSPKKKIWFPHPEPSISLPVCYIDDEIVVVNKPSGIPSVPLGPREQGTLAGAVVYLYPECRTIYRHPGDGGLLQRLDRETSGAVMVARTKPAFEFLVSAQQKGEIEKRYLALVHTEIDIPSIVDLPLSGNSIDGQTVVPKSDGRRAVTHLSIKQKKGPWTLLEATIHKGARHQIRAHLAALGMPIVGDKRYSNRATGGDAGRLFLHAHCLTFIHPTTTQTVRVCAPLSDDLVRFIEKNLIISL